MFSFCSFSATAIQLSNQIKNKNTALIIYRDNLQWS